MTKMKRTTLIISMSLLFILGMSIMILAATDDLDVTSCETTACTAANLNTNDTTSGVTVGKAVVTQPVMDNLPGDASTINNVVLRIRWTENTKTDGTNEVNLQADSTNTDYCTAQTDPQAASGDEYHEFDFSACRSWTVAEVNDLQVYYLNNDGGSAGKMDLTFVDVYVDYDVSAGGDSCDYDTGDFIIDCTEECTVDTDYDIGGNSIVANGNGVVNVVSTLQNYDSISSEDGCAFVVHQGVHTG